MATGYKFLNQYCAVIHLVVLLACQPHCTVDFHKAHWRHHPHVDSQAEELIHDRPPLEEPVHKLDKLNYYISILNFKDYRNMYS